MGCDLSFACAYPSALFILSGFAVRCSFTPVLFTSLLLSLVLRCDTLCTPQQTWRPKDISELKVKHKSSHASKCTHLPQWIVLDIWMLMEWVEAWSKERKVLVWLPGEWHGIEMEERERGKNRGRLRSTPLDLYVWETSNHCRSLGYVTLRYATLEYWLFWIKGTWKTAGVRTLWPFFVPLKAANKVPMWKATSLYQEGRKHPYH